LEAAGDVRFPSVARIEPRLHVTANRFTFVRTPDLRLIATAAVDLNGSLAAPVAKGKLTLENCSFNLKPSASTRDGPAVQLSPADVRMMEETFGYVSDSGNDQAAQLYDASDLDLDIAIQRNNWLRQEAQPTLSIALTGQVHFRKAPHGEPEM